MCYGMGCPFEVKGFGPMAGECRKAPGLPCWGDYEDTAEYDFVCDCYEEGISPEEAQLMWEERNAADSDEEMC